MSGAPAFQFYPHDFLAGRVATYSLQAVGAYILLLSYDWSLNGLPNDVESLAKLCRLSARSFRVLWAEISDQFEESAGRLYNPRLAKERQKQELWRAKSALGGKHSAEKRAKGASTTLEPPYPPKGNTPSPSPVTTKKLAADAAAATRESWVSRLAAVWVAEVGRITLGRLGADLKPTIDQHGEARTERAMRLYVADRKSASQTPKFAWFVESVTVWVERASAPLTVIDGEMSPALELATRPPTKRPA